MGLLNYHKCIACQRGWQSPVSIKNRVEYSRVMLERYPEPEDWYNIRFSDEVSQLFNLI